MCAANGILVAGTQHKDLLDNFKELCRAVNVFATKKADFEQAKRGFNGSFNASGD